MSQRHTWGGAERPTHLKTERQCLVCGLVKVTRHEGSQHWTEWWFALAKLRCDLTPPCDVVRLQQLADEADRAAA